MEIPALQVPWWNLDRQRAGLAQWAGMELEVQPVGGIADGLPTLSLDLKLSHAMQLALTALFAFALGWWARAGMPGMRSAAHGIRRGMAVCRRKLLQALLRGLESTDKGVPRIAIQSRLAAWLVALRPQLPRWRPPRGKTADRDRSGRVARQLELRRLRQRLTTCEDAHALERELQDYASRALRLPGNSSLRGIGESIANTFPRMDGTALIELLHQLDAQLYGGAEGLEIQRWITRFKRLTRDSGSQPDRVGHRNNELPALNPALR